MRWKSLLTCWSASMCSTMQSPRAVNAFSSAWAARTCPAPDDADSSSTRGFVFMPGEFPGMGIASRGLALSGGQFFQDSPCGFLQLPETRQVLLKIVIEELRVLRAELRSQNHVAQFYRVREQRLFLQFLKRGLSIVVIHGFPPAAEIPQVYSTRPGTRPASYRRNWTWKQD